LSHPSFASGILGTFHSISRGLLQRYVLHKVRCTIKVKYLNYLLNLFVLRVVGVFIVVLVTYIGDKYGAKSSGLLSAFPTVSATSLFIIALENGNSFASKASLSSLFGLAAVNFFTFGFYYGYTHSNRKKLMGKTFFASIVGFIIYSIIIFAYIVKVQEGTIYNLIPLIISFVIMRFIFRSIKEEKSIKEENSLLNAERIRTINYLARACLGGTIVIIAIILANTFGSIYGGIFSAFPATVAPILIILALTHTESFLLTTIKYVPSSLLATGVYALSVWHTYPIHGYLIGILISYMLFIVAVYILNILKLN